MIRKYSSLPEPSYSFAVLNLMTLAIFYAKVEDDLYLS